MIGKEISPILEEIENTLWEFEGNGGLKPQYTPNGFRGGIKIFMSVLMDKIWELQEKENMNIDDRMNMSMKFGEELVHILSFKMSYRPH